MRISLQIVLNIPYNYLVISQEQHHHHLLQRPQLQHHPQHQDVTCYTYDIENPSQETYCTVYYTACPSGPSTLIVIPPGQIARVDCACENSFVYECLLNISLVAACQSTTPTPTPTLTNTPTPSCGCKEWVVLECAGTCSGGLCVCESSFATTVYTDCTVTNPSNPGTFLYDSCDLISPWTGDFQYGSVIYNSTGSDVVFVCNVGGPC